MSQADLFSSIRPPPPVSPPKGGRVLLLVAYLRRWAGQLYGVIATQINNFHASKKLIALSRIDLCVGAPNMVSYTSKVEYFPRVVSDHSPLAFWLLTQPSNSLRRAPWKLNAFWLKIIYFKGTDSLSDWGLLPIALPIHCRPSKHTL